MSQSHPRREFLKFGLALPIVAAPILAAPVRGWCAALDAPVAADCGPRKIAVHNLHTGESLDEVFWEGGRYVDDALSAVNHVLRDFRTGEVHAIDPRLLDLLDTLAKKTEAATPFQVVSGYRSPRTNARLHRESHGVAEHSLHMKGMAIDIRLAGVDLSRLHQAALSLGAGGVGYYPASDFVHVDVGPVRSWG